MKKKSQEEKGIDPRLNFILLQKAEEEIKKQFHQKEKELKQLLEELKASHNLIQSASREVEEFHQKEAVKQSFDFSESADEEIVSLEETLKNISEEKQKFSSSQSPVYASVSAQQLLVSLNTQTIASLYGLVEKPQWSKEESEQFLDMQYAVSKTMQYSGELTPSLQEVVGQTYSVLQTVREQKAQQIHEAYGLSSFKQHEPLEKKEYAISTSSDQNTKLSSLNDFSSKQSVNSLSSKGEGLFEKKNPSKINLDEKKYK
jgi:hypothetical protein